MLIAEKSLLAKLTVLQSNALNLVQKLARACVVLRKREWDSFSYEGFLVRIDRDEEDELRKKMKAGEIASDEEYIAALLEIAPNYRLAFERDVTVLPVNKPFFLDDWPEKAFFIDRQRHGESAENLNYCPILCLGTLEEIAAGLVEYMDMFFEGWHLASDEECECKYSHKRVRAVWRSDWEVDEALKELTDIQENAQHAELDDDEK